MNILKISKIYMFQKLRMIINVVDLLWNTFFLDSEILLNKIKDHFYN